MMQFDTSQRISAASSMVLILLMQMKGDEIVKTIILAAIGATSSYFVTLLVKFLLHYVRKKF